MTPPPTSIDGTDITGATIDGQDVQEITVDGDTVFTAGPTIIDDFEDGSASPDSPWNPWFSREGSGSLSAQSTFVISGSFTGEHESFGDFRLDESERDSLATGDFTFKFLMRDRSGQGASPFGSDYFKPFLRNGTDVTNSSGIHNIEYRYNGNIVDDNTQNQLGTWQTEVVNTVRYNNDFANDQYEVIFNGTSLGTVDFNNSANAYGALSLINSTQLSFSAQSVFIDDIAAFD